MMIHEITEKVGAHKKRKRVGRGVGSGHGKTAGRGHKGAGSRSGFSGSVRASREGGQMPLFRRFPKRGFSNAKFRTEYAVVNIKALDARFDDGAEVNPDMLVKVGLISDTRKPVKILAEGDTSKKLAVTAARFSAAAKEKIEKAGGTVTVIE
ncbi:MAG: 50S ribosomal protein L15 [Phycisphaeraceae bacterium]|nr:50S ribosomal protein L15 [Phycisphaeraceae bacterium]